MEEEKKIDTVDNNDIKAPEFNSFLESVELKNTNINKNEIDIKSDEAVTQSQIIDKPTKEEALSIIEKLNKEIEILQEMLVL